MAGTRTDNRKLFERLLQEVPPASWERFRDQLEETPIWEGTWFNFMYGGRTSEPENSPWGIYYISPTKNTSCRFKSLLKEVEKVKKACIIVHAGWLTQDDPLMPIQSILQAAFLEVFEAEEEGPKRKRWVDESGAIVRVCPY